MISRFQGRISWLSALVGLLIILSPALPAHAATSCFTTVGQCIDDPFNTYWQNNGQLQVFGYPLTTLQPETNQDTSKVYLTQWFERERLELHPENAVPYSILLGRLGAQALQEQGRDWTTFPKADPSTPHYFAVTGHAIAPQFWNYWSSHGLDLGATGTSYNESVALFGYPLSEPAMETNSSGDTVLTQWFERARFEYHPNNPDPYKVLLGLLGREVHTIAAAEIPPPFYENRAESAVEFMISYYNAINRKEYQRAYDYWQDPGSGDPTQPTDFPSFQQGFATTASVAVTLGTPQGDAGAGNIYATVPAVVVAIQNDGNVQTYYGCYVTHHTNIGIDPDPNALLWKLYRANISLAPEGSNPATLLGQNCPAN